MYYIIFIIGLILILFKENKIQFYIYSGILFLLSAFRFGVGADYFSYQYLYQVLNTNIFLEITQGIGDQEILFRVFGSLLKGLHFSYQQYIMVIAFISIFFIAKLCLEFSSRPTLSLFLYYSFFYFVWIFSGFRQGLVLAIGMYVYLWAKRENKGLFAFLVFFILIGVHSSAIMLIALYLVTNFSWNREKLIFISLLSIIVSLLPIGSLLYALPNISIFGSIVNYVPSEYSVTNMLDIQSLARIFFLILGLIFYDSIIKKDKHNQVLMNTYIIGLNTYFLLNSSELVAARISIYGFYLIILVLPEIFSLFRVKFDKLVIHILMIIFCVLYFNKELTAMTDNSNLIYFNNSGLVPYTNIWNINDNYFFHSLYIDLIN